MRDDVMTWKDGERPVDTLGVEARASFITRTYVHVFLAILAFVGVAAGLLQTSLPVKMLEFMSGGSLNWLLFLGGFIVLGSLASSTAMKARTLPVQYLALGGFVVAEAFIFLPLLFVADATAPGTIRSAALVTLAAFAGLTAIVFMTRKDFSFLRGIVSFGMVLAVVAIVAGAIFGFQLGTWFMVAMVGLAGASILWNTSNVLHHYPEDRYVGAALSLFASVALLFYYVLMLFLSGRD